ncbi:P-loop NTPase family protein [Loigolactobacillus zhaoyuanensis]|uniref:ABC transporter n=1 Tax=Loigolactobacillus zhaoyuanensis TaxID=2486017 RepID=A0ABW8UCQ3_9LACO
MFSFYSTKNQNSFLNKWQTVFVPGQLYFINVPLSDQRRLVIQRYLKLFTQHHLHKRLGIITTQEDVLLPYLSVRENILLNLNGSAEKKYPWQAVYEHEFFEKDAVDLTTSERFYVQLYRNIFAGKDVILVNATLDDYPPAVMRAVLLKLNQITKNSPVTMVFLTANQELLSSEREQSLHTIPFLTTK